MEISIVLLTYNYPEQVKLSLDHIRKYADVPYELIVVDNGSKSELLNYLKSQDDIRLISNPDDKGIARSYNQGAEIANGNYILFMNCYSLLTEKCLSSMLKCMQNEDNCAIVGPVSNNVSGYQNIQIPYKDINQLNDFVRQNRDYNLGAAKQVFRILSHCMLIKKEAIEKIGNFDERFGLGTYEDDDFCLRAINYSYSLYIALDAFVYYINPFSLPDADSDSYFKRLRENRQKAIDKWGFDIASYLLNMKVPITISVCMIVKNEEEALARCLDSVQKFADEIIIVDTGSTDRTKEIAKNYTNKVYDFTWIDDFAAARNFSFSHATKEYILWLDADDVVSEDDGNKILRLKQTLDWSVDAVTMDYNLAFDAYGNVTTSLRRNRLVKRSKHFQWLGAVHEYLAVHGKIIDSDIAIMHKSEWHDSDRNLRIYEKRLAKGEPFTPRDQFYYANELFDHKQYEKAIEWYQKFLEGGQGWIEDNLSACKKLANCFHQLKDMESAEKYIFKSFVYDTPRAEFCCLLGYHFQLKEQYRQAAFWYKLATQLERPADNKWFVDYTAWTWVPHIQLCVCYDRLGEYELAYHHNEMAAKFIPDDPSVLHNREYLRKRLGLNMKNDVF